MKLLFVVLAVVLAVSKATDVEKPIEDKIALAIAEGNLEIPSSNLNSDVLEVDADSLEPVEREKRGLFLGKKLILAKAGLLGLGWVEMN